MKIPETAVVLSGGEGARLRPITQDIPKGLVGIAGKPMLQWVVEWLRDEGVSDIVIGVAYLKEKIMRFFGDGRKLGVNIRYSVHTVEGGTGEGFRLAIRRNVHQESFFAINGDQITDLSLRSLFRVHSENGAIATIGVIHPRLPFGLVRSDDDGYCQEFVEKPIMKDVTCSAGIYAFEKTIVPFLPVTGDVESTTFPALTKKKRLKCYVHDGQFLTVNTLKELEEAERDLKGSKGK